MLQGLALGKLGGHFGAQDIEGLVGGDGAGTFAQDRRDGQRGQQSTGQQQQPQALAPPAPDQAFALRLAKPAEDDGAQRGTRPVTRRLRLIG